MTHKLEKCYQSNEYVDMPEFITITLKLDADIKIKQISDLITSSPIKIRSIDIDTNEVFYAEYSEFEELDFRIGHDCVNIFSSNTWYLTVQNKYDSSLEAEYSLVTES